MSSILSSPKALLMLLVAFIFLASLLTLVRPEPMSIPSLSSQEVKEEPRTADAPAPHAVDKHAKEFEALGTTIETQWQNCRQNPKNDWVFTRLPPDESLDTRVARVCNIKPGHWTIDISEVDGTSVTTFVAKEMPELYNVVEYLYSSGYLLPGGMIIAPEVLRVLQ